MISATVDQMKNAPAEQIHVLRANADAAKMMSAQKEKLVGAVNAKVCDSMCTTLDY